MHTRKRSTLFFFLLFIRIEWDVVHRIVETIPVPAQIHTNAFQFSVYFILFVHSGPIIFERSCSAVFFHFVDGILITEMNRSKLRTENQSNRCRAFRCKHFEHKQRQHALTILFYGLRIDENNRIVHFHWMAWQNKSASRFWCFSHVRLNFENYDIGIAKGIMFH